VVVRSRNVNGFLNTQPQTFAAHALNKDGQTGGGPILTRYTYTKTHFWACPTGILENGEREPSLGVNQFLCFLLTKEMNLSPQRARERGTKSLKNYPPGRGGTQQKGERYQQRNNTAVAFFSGTRFTLQSLKNVLKNHVAGIHRTGIWEEEDQL